jgi:serine/threonine-protein kinase
MRAQAIRSNFSSDYDSMSAKDTTQHVRLGNLFERALELAPEQRERFIAEACGDDVALRQDLTSLLQAHEAAGDDFENLSALIVTPALSAMTRATRDAFSVATLEQLQQDIAHQYRIERELGGAGMSRVFLAEEIRLKRRVVIKVLPAEMVPTANAERFQREIELAAKLQHPHIVPLLTTDTASGTLYYTMPYVTGESLRDRLAREGALPLDDALRIWRDLLDALAHAHASGVIHCDIKPGNILLSGRNALVADFGIALAIETAGGDARAATAGLGIGTPAYMAPEQVTGKGPVDHRVDLYATGAVMYETIMGHPPFTAGSTRELLETHVTREPPPLQRSDVPERLRALVMSCLAEDPAARPQSADAMLAALDASVTGEAVVDRMEASAPTSQRRRVARYALALFALAVVLFTGTRLWSARGLAPATPAVTPSVAVLPLTSSSGNSADAALADRLTQELTGILGRTRRLRVIPGTSAASLRARQMNVREIGQNLRASHVLEGGVQKDGSRLRMQLRLVDVRDGSSRRLPTYEREMGDTFLLLDDIARAVARELDVHIASSGRTAARRRNTIAAAYEWYQKGSDRLAGLDSTLEFFSRAIAIDSNYAAAYAAFALRDVQGGETPAERAAAALVNESAVDAPRKPSRAEQAALKALALDDSLGDAHAALGWVRLGRQRKWADAEREFQRAIALDAHSLRAFEGLARLYMTTGRFAEQLAAAQAGLDVDPFSYSAIRELALALSTNGRCDEALERLLPLKSLSRPPSVAGVLRGQCYAAKQMWPEAIAEFSWADTISDRPGVALAFLGYALARGGHRAEATSILSDLESGRKDSLGAFGIATVYFGLGDRERAFAWLDKAVDEGPVRVYLWGPMFDELRKDARFADVKKRMGL